MVWSLRIVSSLTPGRALVFIGATFVEKIGLSLGMAGDDAEKIKFTGALVELAGTAGTFAVGAGETTAAVAAAGVTTAALAPAAILILACASLAYSASAAYDQYKKL